MTDLKDMDLDQGAIQNANDNTVEATEGNTPSGGFFTGVGHGLETIPPGLRLAFGGSEETPAYQKQDVDLINSLSPSSNASMFNQFGYSVGSVLPLGLAGGVMGSVEPGPGTVTGAMALPGLVAKAEEKNRLLQQGVNPATAEEMGQTAGLATSASMVVPANPLGEVPLALKMAGGAVVQRALGKGQTVVASKILDDAGYHDMAEQYRDSDKNAAAGEYITGAFFGGMSHLHGQMIKPSDVDHADMATNLHQLEVESAPAIPANPVTRDMHIEAMRQATQQMMNGEPVDVSDIFTGGDVKFAIKPEEMTDHKAYANALEEAGFHEQADKYRDLIFNAESEDNFRQSNISLRDQASQQLAGLYSDRQSISDEINRPLSVSEKIGMADPITGERLQAIEEEMQKPGTSRIRLNQLEREHVMLTEGADMLDINDKLKQRQEGLTSDGEKTDQLIEQKQKEVDEYTKNVQKSIKKLNAKKAKVVKEAPSAPAEEPIAPEGLKPEVAGGNPAEDVLQRNPALEIVKEDGTGITTAADAIKEAGDTGQLETAKNVIQAAINCFLRSGE